MIRFWSVREYYEKIVFLNLCIPFLSNQRVLLRYKQRNDIPLFYMLIIIPGLFYEILQSELTPECGN